MVFYPPAWVPELPIDPPDSVTIEQFMKSEKFGRCPIAKSRNPFTCGLTGKTYTTVKVFERTDNLSRAVGKRMGWSPNQSIAWDKVMGIFAYNTIDYMTAVYSVHRFSGIVTPANAAYSAVELTHQLKSSGALGLFTCVPLLETAVEAAKGAGIPKEKIFILSMPGYDDEKLPFATLEDLINEGKNLPEVEELEWTKGQGARQTAFLCYSSGTSGLPKAVMISHRNVIANTMQTAVFESKSRKESGVETQVALGLLPLSHIYGLVVIAHTGVWRGDGVVILPKFELKTLLAAIQNYKIETLYVVPPIIIHLLSSQEVASKYDLSSVRFMFSGAAPAGEETIADLKKFYPKWTVGQGYGMTETSTVVSATSEHDVLTRSSGSLVPGTKAKIIDAEGKEITVHDKPGELLVQSPSVTLGYLNNEKATDETFVYHDDGRWIRTGDEVLITKSPMGNEHVVIVDRIKELIKVKGHQVAPAELEAHLLSHPDVADTAVIQVPDARSGEVPKAFVVKTGSCSKSDDEVAKAVIKYVEKHKASYKWLKGGIEFLEEIPKSPSGKILRRLLRDKEKEKRRKQGGKL